MNETEQACAAPPQPEGRIVARLVQIDFRETFELDTGYSRTDSGNFLWLSGWRAWIAVRVLKALS